MEAKFDAETRRLKSAIDNLRAVGSVPRFRNDTDMRGNRVSNIQDAVADTDAINKRQSDSTRGRSFITVDEEAVLPAERKWLDGANIEHVDGGPNSTFQVSVDTTGLTLDGYGFDDFFAFAFYMA